jgi:tryptophan synthase alpha chain
VLDALVEGGADLIELGMPFTDPMADGPAIQLANLRSLGAGTKTADIFASPPNSAQRHPQTPLILMGYANPMTGAGRTGSPRHACQGGRRWRDLRRHPARGRCRAWPGAARRRPRFIRLATPTTDAARLPAVLEGSSGFLYYVSVAGITGKQQAAQTSIEQAVAHLKSGTDLPIAVGFGVRTPEQAAAIGRVADGVVVGGNRRDRRPAWRDAAPHVKEYVASLRAALRSRRPQDELDQPRPQGDTLHREEGNHRPTRCGTNAPAARR